MGFLCLVYPWDVVLQAKSEGGIASGEVGFLGVGAFIINYCMRMRVLLGFDFSVLRLSEKERERWQLGICEEIGTRYLNT